MKRLFTVSLCVLVTLLGFAQMKKSDRKIIAAVPSLDKAYLQAIWDGWSTTPLVRTPSSTSLR